jgi:hypothetical protein
MRSLIVILGAIAVTLILFNEPNGVEVPAGLIHTLSFGADWPVGLAR